MDRTGRSFRPTAWRQSVRWLMEVALPPRFFLGHGPRRRREVCLTFDDGPDPDQTPRLLDALARSNVPATFFLIGERAERHPGLVQRIAAEGHDVGHHSYHHGSPEQTSATRLIEEVERTARVLTDLLGRPPSLFRPPLGSLTPAKLWNLWQAEQTVVLWNVDPRDYLLSSRDDLLSFFQSHPLKGGDLVLLHDVKPWAAEALPGLAAMARASGIAFERVSAWTTR